MDSPHNRSLFKIGTNISTQKYAEEQTIVLGIFPETLWVPIINKLAKYPHSFVAVGNTSLVLYDVQRNYNLLNYHLFSLVWPMLFDHMIHRADFVGNKRVYRNVISNCRAVCKLWCSVVDNFFGTHQGHYPNPDEYFLLNPDTALSNWPSISEVLNLETKFHPIANGKAEKFLTHFRSSHEQSGRSPFLSGAVVLRLDARETNQLQDEIVWKYGNHILHCRLEIIGVDFDIYNKLAVLMTQMSNLKSLQISDVCCLGFDELPQTLPTLQALRYLKIGQINDDIADQLFFQHKDVLTHLEFSSDNSCFYREINPVNFPNLKHFKIVVSNINTPNLLSLAQNAKAVEVHVEKHRCWPFYAYLQKFEQSLPESCKKLIISLKDDKMLKSLPRAPFRLKLKSVQQLKLLLANYHPIDFVRGMEGALEVLHVAIPESSPYEIRSIEPYESWKLQSSAASIMQKEEIKFLSCLDQIENSNVWDILPKLRILQLDLWNGKKVEHWEKRQAELTKRISRERISIVTEEAQKHNEFIRQLQKLFTGRFSR